MLIVSNLMAITWQQMVMWVIGALLIYLAVKKGMEPTLLLPMGFGAILVNLPFSGAIDQIYNGELFKVPIYWGGLLASVHFLTTNNLNYKRFKRIHNEATTPGSGYDQSISAETAKSNTIHSHNLFLQNNFPTSKFWKYSCIPPSFTSLGQRGNSVGVLQFSCKTLGVKDSE